MDGALYFETRRGRNWTRVGDARVRGTAFLDGELRTAAELARLVSERRTAEDLRALLRRLNGAFAVVCRVESGVAIAADHVRTWPLYYAVDDGDVYVGDTPEWVHREAATRGYDPLAATEYLFTCYVTGPDTLSRDVQQLQAGEIVRFDLDGPTTDVSRSRYLTVEPRHTDESPDLEALDRVLVGAFERLIEYADGRTILMGLSAGSDSRLIALMLRRLGYDDVVTFTYELSPSEDEIEPAASIARDLGFEHVPIRLSHEAFRDLYASDEWEALHRSVGYLGELPDIKRIVALKRLRESAAVPDDAVVVSGDLPIGVGTFLSETLQSSRLLTREAFLESMWSSYYRRWSLDRCEPDLREFLYGRLLEGLPGRPYADARVESVERAIAASTTWYWQERSPKYLIAAPSIDYVGFDRWLPLWDREYLAFWTETDFDELIGKRAHRRYVDRLDADVRGPDATAPDSGRTVRDAAWDLCRRTALSLPGPLKRTLGRGYRAYEEVRGDSEYATDARFGVVPEEEFERFRFPEMYHPVSFQYLLLYRDGFFDTDGDTELDEALPDN